MIISQKSKFFEMSFDWKSILKVAWICCCILAALSTMVWQCYNFYKGEENTLIEYRTFNEMKTDVYPSIGLCWTMPINEENLKRYGNEFTPKEYARFLAGEHWDERMLTVDYDNVTPRFENYIDRYGYRYSSLLYDSDDAYDKEKGELRSKKEYKEHSVLSYRCFSIEIPFKKDRQLNGLYMFLDHTIFGETGRLANPFGDALQQNEFRVMLHYPNQWLRKMEFAIRNWPVRGPSSSKGYLIRLRVGDIEVRARRDSNYRPCTEGLYDYDEMVKKYVLEKIGCKPPYMNSTLAYAPCTERKELNMAYTIFTEAIRRGNRYLPLPDQVDTPCRSLERAPLDGKDVEIPADWIEREHWMNTSVGVMVDFTGFTYKEVKNVRGMDLQALIGKF